MGTLERIAKNLFVARDPVVIILPSRWREEMIIEWEHKRGILNNDLLPTHISGVPFMFAHETRRAYLICDGFDSPTIHFLCE